MTSNEARFVRPETDFRFQLTAFVLTEQLESAARAAASIDRPWIAKIASAKQPIAYACEPLQSRPDAPLSVEQAAECATQVCVVLAELHARGWVGLSHDTRAIRVLRDERDRERWRAEVVVPPMPRELRFVESRVELEREDYWSLPLVDRDLCNVVAFFVDLLAGYVPQERWRPTTPTKFALPTTLTRDALRALRALQRGTHVNSCPRNAATLAAIFASLTPDPAAWSETIASLPHARPLELTRDWKRLCALGEAEREEVSRHNKDKYPYVALPLANAWHQRAVELYEARQWSDALECIDRCIEIDPFARYITTKGTIQWAAGAYAAAIETFGVAIKRANGREAKPNVKIERARALYARAVARMCVADQSGARRDLGAASRALRALDTTTEDETLRVEREALHDRIAAALEKSKARSSSPHR